MTYFLGIDLGTTYTAAAIYQGDHAAIVDLSSRGATIPSIVLLTDSGQFLVGDAASRRALMEPARAAQQFKRRFGDTTPIFLGGTPFSADQLSAQMLKAVVAQVEQVQGSPPAHVTITHPANWGGYKLELLEQSIRAAGLDGVTTITEPEAAVLHYAQLERVPSGALIAVFDLGGGTFDAAIVRKTDTGTEFLGRPEGVERLGGIDFDDAVFGFVSEHLDGALDDLDVDDPATRSALERLRAECVEVKEALSADEVADVAVMLPTLQTTIRMTRAEFEGLIRPLLGQAIESLERSLKSAGLEASALDAVLLAGGSSRIPLVAEMVGVGLGRPVAVDSHPKHVVALGAALAARQTAAADVPAIVPQSPTEPIVVAAPPTPDTTETTEVVATAPASDPTAPMPVAAMPPAATPPAAPPPGTPPQPSAPSSNAASKKTALIAAGVLAVLLIGAGAFFALGGDDESADPNATPIISEPAATALPVTDAVETTLAASSSVAPTTVTTLAATTTAATTTTTTLPFPADTRRVELTEIAAVDGKYEITYETTNFLPSFDVDEFHIHFFWNTEDPASVGMGADPIGDWVVWALRSDGAPVFDAFGPAANPGGATAICGVVATDFHAIDAPEYVEDTVSCIDV